MNTPKTIEERVEEFSKGYYSFRFEYTDKSNVKRYEIAVWNDGMPPEDALKYITKHISGYKNGKITDFIDNQYFQNILRQALSKQDRISRESEREKIIELFKNGEWRKMIDKNGGNDFDVMTRAFLQTLTNKE